MNSRTIFAVLLFLTIVCQAWAYDFSKKISNGITVYFSVNKSDEATVSVVAPYEDGYGMLMRPSGRLAIPDEIQYDGVVYRVTAISRKAFADCNQITAVTIPASVTNIDICAFENCSQMHSLTFRCDSLSQVVNAFVGCTGLDTIVIDESVRVMPPFVFSELKSVKHIRLLSGGYRMRNLFFGLQSQTTLAVGENVTQIPPFICYNFSGLKSVVYEGDGHSITTIGQCAFSGCTGLLNIEIPANVSRIESYAYAHCVPQSITFLSKRPPSVSEIAFYGIDAQTPVFVPCSTRGVYANSGIGHYFSNLTYMDDCQGGVETEVIYIHDTVFVHDTIYLPYTEFVESHFVNPKDTNVVDTIESVQDETEETAETAEPRWLFIDGKILRISNATQMRGVSVRVFDDKGRLVVDERIPADQPTDNYYIKLPNANAILCE